MKKTGLDFNPCTARPVHIYSPKSVSKKKDNVTEIVEIGSGGCLVNIIIRCLFFTNENIFSSFEA